MKSNMDIRLPSKNSVEVPIQLDLKNVGYLTPTIMNGKIIEVKYQLHARLKMDACRSSFSVIIPIVIGTVALPVERSQNIV